MSGIAAGALLEPAPAFTAGAPTPERHDVAWEPNARVTVQVGVSAEPAAWPYSLLQLPPPISRACGKRRRQRGYAMSATASQVSPGSGHARDLVIAIPMAARSATRGH